MNDNIKRILDSIEKVAPQAWQKVVEYTKVSAATEVAQWLVAMIFFASLTRFCYKYIDSLRKEENERKAKGDYYRSENKEMQYAFASAGLAAGCLVIFMSTMEIFEQIPIYLNPEGHIIKVMLGK